jgi:S1-C subfamily serine protease
MDGGAAKDAGVKSGDIIVKVGDINVDNVPELQEQIGKFSPGDKIAVTLERDGKDQVIDMTLRGRTGATAASASAPEETRVSKLGAEFAPASAAELKALGLDGGVKVLRINGGKLRSSGIREGFIITRIDQVPMKDPKDIEKALDGKQGGVLIEGVYPNGMRAYYGLGV